MATRVVGVNDILEGRVGLDLECSDRIYLNGWVPNLQVSGQVVNLGSTFGVPIPSPVILERIGLRFRKAVMEFAAEGDIPVIPFVKGQRKLEVMRPHLDRLVRQGTDRGRGDRGGSGIWSGCSRAAPTTSTRGVVASCGSVHQGRPPGHRLLLLSGG